jgi:ATPase subunit of ABC transporter with duplicated ATPase domains
VKQKIGTLSEGQKGLVALACLVLQQPAILIVDEVNQLLFLAIYSYLSLLLILLYTKANKSYQL